MPLSDKTKDEVYAYCNNHLAEESWYKTEFEFIEDDNLRNRLVEEFKSIRFAYKLYEGIGAKGENLVFEIRHQIFAYATIYEAVIHYILYSYYSNTQEFHDLRYHQTLARVCIPTEKLNRLQNELMHDGKTIIPMYTKERKKDDSQIRFDDKCRTAEKLGLIHSFINEAGETVDLPTEIIEIYSYRNAIHLVAEQRKGIHYELDLSKRAYRRMRPFIDQIKDRLDVDKVGIYLDKKEVT